MMVMIHPKNSAYDGYSLFLHDIINYEDTVSKSFLNKSAGGEM